MPIPISLLVQDFPKREKLPGARLPCCKQDRWGIPGTVLAVRLRRLRKPVSPLCAPAFWRALAPEGRARV